MPSIQIICFGKTKEKYFIEPFLEYKKRLSSWINVDLIELPTVSLSSANNINIVKNKEGDILLKTIQNSDYLIVLSEEGEQLSSTDFTQFIDKAQLKGNIKFIIGGTYGLDERIKKRANFLLSFSKMTFTHEMIRVFLIEQIYRAYTILKNKKYHY